MSSLAERIVIRMEDLKMYSQASLARSIGMSPPALNKILMGLQTDMKGSNLLALSRVLRCRPEWLLTGKGPREISEQNGTIPLIEWNEIKSFISGNTNTDRNVFINQPNESINVSFALKVADTTMQPRLFPGDYIFIDIQHNASMEGRYILVESDRSVTPQVRQLVTLDGVPFLKLLSPDLPNDIKFAKKSTSDNILGVIVGMASIFEV